MWKVCNVSSDDYEGSDGDNGDSDNDVGDAGNDDNDNDVGDNDVGDNDVGDAGNDDNDNDVGDNDVGDDDSEMTCLINDLGQMQWGSQASECMMDGQRGSSILTEYYSDRFT